MYVDTSAKNGPNHNVMQFGFKPFSPQEYNICLLMWTCTNEKLYIERNICCVFCLLKVCIKLFCACLCVWIRYLCGAESNDRFCGGAASPFTSAAEQQQHGRGRLGGAEDRRGLHNRLPVWSYDGRNVHSGAHVTLQHLRGAMNAVSLFQGCLIDICVRLTSKWCFFSVPPSSQLL